MLAPCAGGSELYAYDFATSKLTMISNHITGAPSFLSSSIVCGNYYHGNARSTSTALLSTCMAY